MGKDASLKTLAAKLGLLTCASLCCLGFFESAYAAPIRLKLASVSVTLTENKNQAVIGVKVPGGKECSLLEVKEPNRLVLDCSGANAKKNINVQVPKSHWIKSVRLGAHPDKIRLVLDLISEKFPAYSSQGDPQNFAITLGDGVAQKSSSEEKPLSPPEKNVQNKTVQSSASPSPAPTAEPSKVEKALKSTPIASPAKETATPLPPTPAPTPPKFTKPSATATATSTASATPTATATATVKPTATASPTASPTRTSTATATATPVANKEAETPIPAATEGAVKTVPTVTTTPETVASLAPKKAFIAPPADAQALSAIDFSFSSDTHVPVIRLKLRKRGEFKLSRKSEKEFVLSLPGAKVEGEHLTLAHFPPRDFMGIDVVKANLSDTSLEVSILVGHGVKLTAVAKDTEIWIKPLNR